MPAVFSQLLTVPNEVMDDNGHVSNIAYIEWMQEVATRHSDAQGCTRKLYTALGSSWFIRAQRIEYLNPAYAGENIVIQTWVSNLKRMRSLRRYRFVRICDRKVLATAETDWVYVSLENGRPRRIDPEVAKSFMIVPPEEEENSIRTALDGYLPDPTQEVKPIR